MKSRLRFSQCPTESFAVRLQKKLMSFPLISLRKLHGKQHPYGRSRLPHRD